MDPPLLLRPLRVAVFAARRPSLLRLVRSLERIRQQHPLLGTALNETQHCTAGRMTLHRDLRMIAIECPRTLRCVERILKRLF